MATRIVEGKKPYTGGKAIEITEDKVINLRLRSENNLIIYDSGDNEIYVDLQLPDELRPTDAFPVGITTGRAVVDNGWDKEGTIVCFKTTSGDNIKLYYTDEGKVYIDNGTGTFKQIYLKGEVDTLLQNLQSYVEQTFQEKLIAGDGIGINDNTVTNTKPGPTVSASAPSNPTEGMLWYDTTNDILWVYNGTQWNSAGGGGGGSGDVIGPSSAIDGNLAVFDGATGKIIKDGGAVPVVPTNISAFINDSGYVTDSIISDTAYANTWDADTTHAPTKNAVYDKISAMDTTISGLVAGPSSATDGHLAVFDGATGKLVKDGGVVPENPNTKTFSLSAVGSTPTILTEAQDILDYYRNGGNPIVTLGQSKLSYVFSTYDSTGTIVFKMIDKQESQDTSMSTYQIKTITISFNGNDEATGVSSNTAIHGYLAPGVNYSTAYTPTYDGSPATKKYVDDRAVPTTGTTGYVLTKDANGYGWANAPVTSVNNNTGAVTVSEFNPGGTATTGYVVTKTANGYEWQAPSGGGGDVLVSSQANNILTSGMKIWAGTETNYGNLGTYDSNTLYLTVE